MTCLCLRSCFRRSHSMGKAVQVISVIDLAISIVYVAYETANFGRLIGLINYDLNCSSIDSSSNDSDSTNINGTSNSNCNTYLREYVPETMLEKVNFDTITVMAMIVLVFLAFIIEGNLYSKLKTGKRLRVHLFIKSWFEWRLVLLLLTVFMAVAKVYRDFYSLRFDGIMDGVTKTYRLITLWCVKCFMVELEETVGVEYVKPPKPRKRGSLALPINLR